VCFYFNSFQFHFLFSNFNLKFFILKQNLIFKLRGDTERYNCRYHI